MTVTAPAPVPTAAAAAAADAVDDSAPERDFVRKVAVAWLLGILAWAVIGTGIALLAGGADDIGIGGCIAIGVFSGIWLAPLAGVVGVGRWAARWQH